MKVAGCRHCWVYKWVGGRFVLCCLYCPEVRA